MLNNNARNALFIINPASGKKDKTSGKKIIKAAKKLGWNGMMEETSVQKGSGIIAKEAVKKGIKYFVVCGGDGTVREVVGEAVKHKIPIGIVPLGTGNIFAKNLKIPLNIKDSVATALTGKIENIDVASANGNYFVLIAGMGLDVKAMDEARGEFKRRFGMFAYIFAAFKNIFSKSRRYKIIVDNKKEVKVNAKSILIANIGKTEREIKVVPKAWAKSGDLKIGIIKATGPLSWVEILVNLLRGKVNESSKYDLLNGKKIVVYPLSGKELYECDGNVFTKTSKLTVEIHQAALRVCKL